MSASPGLEWRGRWGACESCPIHVLAPVVVVLEAGLKEAQEEDERWYKILEVVGSNLSGEIKGQGVLAAIHWKNEWQPVCHRRLMHALILGDVAACQSVWQRHWQSVRRLLNDKAFVVWKEIIDTADPDPLKHHCRRLRGALQLRSFDSPGLALELPIEWLDASGEFEALKESPWQRLFQSFGALLLLERISVEPGRVVLLACFREPRAAVAMYECLAGRCLYFPKDGTSCFPCSCTLRDYDALKAQLCRKERVQDDEPTFILRRMGAAVRPRPPEVILVTTSRPSLVCGREGTDVSLRAAHVSKTHAVLRLSRYGNSYRLTVEDKSSNGTWVNGVRLKAEPMVLKARDQICFVPPAHDVEQLLYEVLLPNLQRTAFLPAEPEIVEPAPASARSRSRNHFEDSILNWLQSVGDPDLLAYERKIRKLVGSTLEIRRKYGDNISGFLSDLNISDLHKSSFRRALMKLRRDE